MGLLDHKTAAGGNSGIGLATAKRFLAERPELDAAADTLRLPCPVASEHPYDLDWLYAEVGGQLTCRFPLTTPKVFTVRPLPPKWQFL